VAVRLRSSALAPVAADSLTTDTFTVHVRATSPLDGSLAYEQDRVVTGARLEGKQIVLDLEHGYGVDGASTQLYVLRGGRNVLLDLEYTLTQTAPLRKKGNGAEIVLGELVQGALMSPEGVAFMRLQGAGDYADRPLHTSA